MPYITKERKEQIGISVIFPEDCGSGDLNYALTMVIQQYMRTKGLKYQTINDCVGALSCASSEFMVRVGRWYEDDKRCTNGDVYDKEFTNG